MDALEELAANPEGYSEETICLLLSEGLDKLYREDSEAFFALMYRLDIAERSVEQALQSEAAMSVIARLVYQRQLEKARLRKQFRDRKGAEDPDPDLKW